MIRLFRRKPAKMTRAELQTQIAKIREDNDNAWRIATAKQAVDIRVPYSRKGA